MTVEFGKDQVFTVLKRRAIAIYVQLLVVTLATMFLIVLLESIIPWIIGIALLAVIAVRSWKTMACPYCGVHDPIGAFYRQWNDRFHLLSECRKCGTGLRASFDPTMVIRSPTDNL